MNTIEALCCEALIGGVYGGTKFALPRREMSGQHLRVPVQDDVGEGPVFLIMIQRKRPMSILKRSHVLVDIHEQGWLARYLSRGQLNVPHALGTVITRNECYRIHRVSEISRRNCSGS